jgi:hypothetical protein
MRGNKIIMFSILFSLSLTTCALQAQEIVLKGRVLNPQGNALHNDDLLHDQNSFQKWVGVNSPKATISRLSMAGDVC